MSIKPTGDGGRVTGPKDQTTLTESDKATQAVSNGSLLKKIQAKHSVPSEGIFGKFKALFGNRAVKKEYIETLQTYFSTQASTVTSTRPAYRSLDTTQIYETSVAPLLKNMEVQHIENFERGLSHGGMLFLLSIAADSPKDPKSLKHAVDTVATTGRDAPDDVRDIAQNYSTAAELFGFDTAGKDRVWLDTVMTMLATDRPRYQQTMQQHKVFLQQASASPTFQQHVKQKSEEDVKTLVKYVLTPEGHTYMMQALQGDPMSLIKALDDVIKEQSGKTWMQMATMQVARRMMEKLSENEKVQFQKAWSQTSQELSVARFDDFLNKFSEHLVKMEKLKAEHPAQKDAQDVNESYNDLKKSYPQQMEHFNFLKLR